MSFAESVSPPSQAARRFHARRRVDGLVYVEFGPDNGAILIDLGEGGLSFQSVMPVNLNQALLFKFRLPAESSYIEGYAEVAWTNETGKGGGLRFVELSADACAQIRQWNGALSAPEPGALQAGNGAGSNGAQESATQRPAANEAPESPSPEAQGDDSPAQVSEALIAPESAQTADASAEGDKTLPAVEAAEEQVAAGQDALPEASEIPEFTVEATPAAHWSEPLAGQVEWAAPVAIPIPAASAAVISAPEPKLPHDLSIPHDSNVAKTSMAPEPAMAATANPVKAARTPASDATNFAPAPKRQRKPLPSKPETSLPPAYRQDSAIRGSFVRQAQKPAPGTEWEKLPASQAGELTPQALLASQAIKISVGVAAGASLALALALGVPSLRTRVQATAAERSGALNPASAPVFQIEVADLNNRRWILKSGGEAGSPFSDAPSRRETQSASTRGESAKSSRSQDSGDSSNAVEPPQARVPRPGELALSRPRAAQAAATSAELMAPSIFDGITPPIGSVSDRLAAGGPEAPGIVPPESQSGIRVSALQAAVLVQRAAPVYPSDALQARVQGEVLVNATIGTDGVPKDLKIVRGDPRLTPAALAAIRQWRYRPATLAGQPIEAQIDLTVNFQLK